MTRAMGKFQMKGDEEAKSESSQDFWAMQENLKNFIDKVFTLEKQLDEQKNILKKLLRAVERRRDSFFDSPDGVNLEAE